MEMENGLRPMTAGEIKRQHQEREAGVLRQLPSGLLVRVRPMHLLGLMAGGMIPDPLTGTVREVLRGGMRDPLTPGDAERLRKILDVVAKACLVEPACTDAPDENEIAPGDLSDADKLAIFNFAQGWSVSLLAPFR